MAMIPPGVAYLARLMDLAGWEPQSESFHMLDQCDSQLERMAALGLIFRAEERWSAASGEKMPPVYGDLSWSFVDPWMIFPEQIGPTEMAIRPQVVDHLTRDFIVAYEGQDSVIVEVDGFQVHRRRRDADWMRDQNAPYPTIRFREELEEPIDWPLRLLWHFEDRCNHCGVNLGEHFPCPPF